MNKEDANLEDVLAEKNLILKDFLKVLMDRYSDIEKMPPVAVAMAASSVLETIIECFGELSPVQEQIRKAISAHILTREQFERVFNN